MLEDIKKNLPKDWHEQKLEEFNWSKVPEEDEKLSQEEIAAMERGEKDIKAGKVVDAEEVWKNLDI